MALPMQVGQDHGVLSASPFCAGYTDTYGRRVPEFACPVIGTDDVFCCGDDNFRFCCTSRDQNPLFLQGPTLPLLLSVVIGTAVTFIMVITTALLICMSRRRVPMSPERGDVSAAPVYRVQSSSTASGVANMYSCSYESLAREEAARTPQMAPFPRAPTPSGMEGRYKVSGLQTMPRSFGTHRERTSRVSFVESSRTADVDVDLSETAHVARISPYGHGSLPRPRVVGMGTFPRSMGAAHGASRPTSTLPLTEYLPIQDDGMCRSTKF